jgi:hypothetical protein
VLRDLPISSLFLFERDGAGYGAKSGLGAGAPRLRWGVLSRLPRGWPRGRFAGNESSSLRALMTMPLQHGRLCLRLDCHASHSREGGLVVSSPQDLRAPARREPCPSWRLKTSLAPSGGRERKKKSEEWGRRRTFSPPYTRAEEGASASITTH